MQRLSLLVACALLPFSAGCAHEPTPAVVARTVAASPVRAMSTARPGQAVLLSADLRKVCGIDDIAEAPRFGFDAASLGPTDRSELSQLARCMTTGPLAGTSVELVGRADPRGEAEYNMTLGEHRGESVVRYLGQLGVPPSRLPLTSRGALDAQGHDDATWALDRRVDLRLVGR